MSEARGLAKGAGGVNGDLDYCDNPGALCGVGEGDCDASRQCEAGLICAADLGPQFGMPTSWDVCLPKHCSDGVLSGDETGVDCGGTCGTCVACPMYPAEHPSYCSAVCPCGTGGSDCDSDRECQAGHYCAADLGPAFGAPAGHDVCVPDHCQSGVRDGDETGVDCGPSCGPCPEPPPAPTVMADARVLEEDRAENDGRFSGVVTLRVEGGALAVVGATYQAGAGFTVTGTVPLGLQPALVVETEDRMILRVEGAARPHDAAASTAFTVHLSETLFEGGRGPADGTDLVPVALSFVSGAVVAPDALEWTESVENRGALEGARGMTVHGDRFSAPGRLIEGRHFVVDGVPEGLQLDVVVRTATEADLSWQGAAPAHTPEDDAAPLVRFLSEAFVSGVAPDQGAMETRLQFRANPVLVWTPAGFREAASNDGQVVGTEVLELRGDVFAGGEWSLGVTHDVEGVPEGLSVLVSVTSSTSLAISLGGAATSHAVPDGAALRLSLYPAAFASGGAAQGASSVSTRVDFDNWAPRIYSAGAHDGALGGLDGADALCRAEMPAGLLHQSAVAFLSAQDARALASLPQTEGFTATEPVATDGGVHLAADWADLVDGTIAAALDTAGVMTPGVPRWWSGSTSAGLASGIDCEGWTRAEGFVAGQTGFAAYTTAAWMSQLRSSCSGRYEVLCVAFDPE